MAQEFRAIISVMDRATEPLRRINRSLAALNSPFKGMRGAITQFGAESGLANVSRAVGNLSGKLGALAGTAGGVLGPVAAIGAAASAGGLLSLARDAADLGEELDKASVKTGMTVDQIAKLHHVAEAMHIETGVLDKGLVILNRTLADAARGKNKDAAALFRKLHIEIGGMGKPIKTASDVLPKLTDAFKRNENAGLRVAMANTMFKKSGAELLPILTLGRDEIARLSAEYERYFGKITPQMVKAMRDGDEAFDRASLAAKGLKLSIGASLIPIITPLVGQMTRWIVANRQLISQRVSDFVTNVGNAMTKVDWNGVGRALLKIWHALEAVGTALGPMGTTIAIVAVAFSPFIAGVLGSVFALGRLAFAIGGVVLRLAALLFAPVVAAIGTFVTALGAGFTAMEAFNLVLMMNPIGAVIIGITALCAAAFLIWKYWGPIKGFFGDMWATIVGLFEGAWKKIKPIVDALMKFGAKMWNIFKWTPLGVMIQGGQMAANAVGKAVTGNRTPQGSVIAGPVIQRGQGLQGRNGANGTVHVKVELPNLPQGSRVSTKASVGVSYDLGLRFANR